MIHVTQVRRRPHTLCLLIFGFCKDYIGLNLNVTPLKIKHGSSTVFKGHFLSHHTDDRDEIILYIPSNIPAALITSLIGLVVLPSRCPVFRPLLETIISLVTSKSCFIIAHFRIILHLN